MVGWLVTSWHFYRSAGIFGRVASRQWTTMKCVTRTFENREAPPARTEPRAPKRTRRWRWRWRRRRRPRVRLRRRRLSLSTLSVGHYVSVAHVTRSSYRGSVGACEKGRAVRRTRRVPMTWSARLRNRADAFKGGLKYRGIKVSARVAGYGKN